MDFKDGCNLTLPRSIILYDQKTGVSQPSSKQCDVQVQIYRRVHVVLVEFLIGICDGWNL